MTVVLAPVTEDASIEERCVRPGCSNLLARSSDSDLGLAGYIYTGDPHGSMRLTKLPGYGVVALGAPKFAGAYPFGRTETVGVVRESSKRGLAENLEPKYVCFANPAA